MVPQEQTVGRDGCGISAGIKIQASRTLGIFMWVTVVLRASLGIGFFWLWDGGVCQGLHMRGSAHALRVRSRPTIPATSNIARIWLTVQYCAVERRQTPPHLVLRGQEAGPRVVLRLSRVCSSGQTKLQLISIATVASICAVSSVLVRSPLTQEFWIL